MPVGGISRKTAGRTGFSEKELDKMANIFGRKASTIPGKENGNMNKTDKFIAPNRRLNRPGAVRITRKFR